MVRYLGLRSPSRARSCKWGRGARGSWSPGGQAARRRCRPLPTCRFIARSHFIINDLPEGSSPVGARVARPQSILRAQSAASQGRTGHPPHPQCCRQCWNTHDDFSDIQWHHVLHVAGEGLVITEAGDHLGVGEHLGQWLEDKSGRGQVVLPENGWLLTRTAKFLWQLELYSTFGSL